ncbi:MAG TPA: POTRA domain-containing protein [Acidobacteriota bacterium]|nr:POTRA domain-containing protein [Acidobacteriota bacterium]
MKRPATSAGVALVLVMLASLSPAPGQVSTPKVRMLGTIEFTGNKVFSQETLRKQLRIIRIGGPYNSAMLESDVEKNLKAFLKENGYMTCETSWEERVLADGTVGLRINVVEGIQYHLVVLEIKGAQVISGEELISQFHLRPGDVLNFAEVKQGLERIRRMYSDKGYIDWSYTPEMKFNSDSRTAELRFSIQEGVQYRIAYVGIVGCGEQEEEDRVRSLIGLRPGEFFSQSVLEASVAAINKLGLYQELKEKDYVLMPLEEKPGLVSVVFYLKPRSPRH